MVPPLVGLVLSAALVVIWAAMVAADVVRAVRTRWRDVGVRRRRDAAQLARLHSMPALSARKSWMVRG